MQLEVTGRHIDVTAALREFTEERVHRLERVMDGPIEVHVVLAIEKHRQIAEIKVKTRAAVFSGTQETDDMYVSISDVVDKIERQALRRKEKLRDHRQRKGPRDPDSAARIEAAAALGDDEPVASPQSPRIVRRHSYRLKPLTAEDALLELESSGEDLLVFRDSDDDRVHVIYRQPDGNFRLVEPEF